MTTKDKLTPLLNAFKQGTITLEYTKQYIDDIYQYSQKSFYLGMVTGIVMYAIILLVTSN